jgi:hypothetical protein
VTRVVADFYLRDLMAAVIVLERPDLADPRALIAELDAYQ